jgi:branched-chain amino acid transport system permease protein
MAEAMGVEHAQAQGGHFVIAALFASVSGWLFAHFQRTVNPSPFGLKFGIEYLFMAVLGAWGMCGAPSPARCSPSSRRPTAGAVAQTHRHQWQLRNHCVRHRAGAGAQVPARWRVVASSGAFCPSLSASTDWHNAEPLPERSKPAMGDVVLDVQTSASSSAAWWLSMTSASDPGRADRRADWPQRRGQIHHLQPDDRRAG